MYARALGQSLLVDELFHALSLKLAQVHFHSRLVAFTTLLILNFVLIASLPLFVNFSGTRCSGTVAIVSGCFGHGHGY
jgi:hypothetical protein